MGAAGGSRIALTTIFNVRDLGGYQTAYGLSKSGRFLRSGDTMFLSDEELEFLLDYGVRRVVDLRMSVERPELSDRFASVDGVLWMSASMADDRTMTPEWTKTGRIVEFVLEGYLRMLADRKGIRELVSFMAGAGQEDCVLFHCAAGMDRTGIVSMLILGAAGVRREDLVADYAYSFASDEEVDTVMTSWDPMLPPPAHDGTITRIHAMFKLYDCIVARFGSVRGYLIDCGVDEQTINKLVKHLVS